MSEKTLKSRCNAPDEGFKTFLKIRWRKVTQKDLTQRQCAIVVQNGELGIQLPEFKFWLYYH